MFNPLAISANNPGPKTGSGNHTYLLRSVRGHTFLVDAGVGASDHLRDLESALGGAPLDQVLVTHAHPDHISGAGAIARIYPSARFRKYPWPPVDASTGLEWIPLGDSDRLRIGDDKGDEIVALHTPGHSPDHLAFWHEPSGTVFTGDLVTQGSSVMIQSSAGGDLIQYLQSLERVRALEPRRLLPAHGPVIDDPRALLTSYLEHRMARERQVLAALGRGLETVEAIAESIYDDLHPALLSAAQDTVRAHLVKLQHEGRAVEVDSRWRM